MCQRCLLEVFQDLCLSDGLGKPQHPPERALGGSWGKWGLGSFVYYRFRPLTPTHKSNRKDGFDICRGFKKHKNPSLWGLVNHDMKASESLHGICDYCNSFHTPKQEKGSEIKESWQATYLKRGREREWKRRNLYEYERHCGKVNERIKKMRKTNNKGKFWVKLVELEE